MNTDARMEAEARCSGLHLPCSWIPAFAGMTSLLEPIAPLERWGGMSDGIGDLQRRMEEAAAAMDFEEAKRLRDRIAMIRGGASREEAEKADSSGLTRQQPGRMGLGTSQQRVTPPEGWTPPPKPDPMTRGRARRRGKP